MHSRSAVYQHVRALVIIAMTLMPLATPAYATGNQPPTLSVAGTGSGNVHYVDWLSANPGAGTASGVITLPGGSTVNLTFSAVAPGGTPQGYAFAQTGCGANYWSPSAPYISAEVPNAPPPCDLLALQGGTNTIYRVNLSQPIRDPIMSIVSLGSPGNYTTYDFDSPFTIVSQGTGYWGGNSTTLQQLPGDILRGNEGHGTIKFLGTFSTFSWTVPTPEYWHGFTFAIRATDAFDITPNEGQVAANSGTWGDPDAGDTVTLSASVGTITASPDGKWAWTYATSDGPAQSQTVTITATDSQGASTSRTFALVVRNLPPTATLGNSGPVNIGSPATISFSGQADPSSVDLASLHYAYSCDGTSPTTASYAGSGSSASSTCVFPTSGNKTVVARVIDKDGAFTEYRTIVTVTNLAPPTVDAGGPYTVTEGGSIMLSATGSDPLGGAVSYAWDLDNNGTFESPGQSVGFSAASLDGPTNRTVRVRGCTASLACSTDSAIITVLNVAPVLGTVSSPTTPTWVNTPVAVSAPFTDAGIPDTFTATFDWGDGTSSAGTTSGGIAAGSHSFTSPGVYTVTVTVTDDDGLSATARSADVVIYNPDGGFVTGGGWIESLAGADRADLSAAGKANFGFVAKYKPGQTVPIGNFEFQFKAGDLNFKATSYEWLVLAGAKAQLRGMGTINGHGSYAVTVTVTDNDLLGGADADTVRVQIVGAGGVVYDSQTTALEGGNIVIHR